MTIQVLQNDDPFGVFSFADASRELQIAEDTEDGEEGRRRAKLTVVRRQGTYQSVEVGVVKENKYKERRLGGFVVTKDPGTIVMYRASRRRSHVMSSARHELDTHTSL